MKKKEMEKKERKENDEFRTIFREKYVQMFKKVKKKKRDVIFLQNKKREKSG